MDFMLLGSDRYLWEENVYDISVDYNVIDKSDTLGIHKHLMIKNNIVFGLIKKYLSLIKQNVCR